MLSAPVNFSPQNPCMASPGGQLPSSVPKFTSMCRQALLPQIQGWTPYLASNGTTCVLKLKIAKTLTLGKKTSQGRQLRSSELTTCST